MNLTEQVNYLRHLRRLYCHRLGRLAQPLQFALVGTSGMAVNLAAFALLLTMMPEGFAEGIAYALAIALSMTWNFGLNRRLTFDTARHQPLVPQYLMFCSACLFGAVINWSLCVFLIDQIAWFAEYPPVAAIVGILAGTVFNFAASKYVVFNPLRSASRQPLRERVEV